MPSSVALLRGINVGGRNPVAMPALAESFRDAGHEGVQTYLASGNVLFTPRPDSGPGLEDALETMLLQRFEIPIPVVVRSRGELGKGVDTVTPGPGAIYFSCVAAQASRTRITKLMGLPVFRRMTVRSWRTTTRLLELLDES